jgi:hypothetical protein
MSVATSDSQLSFSRPGGVRTAKNALATVYVTGRDSPGGDSPVLGASLR